MLERAKEIIAEIAEKTDSIILMHSLSGKDSIVLLDLLHPYFKRIVCVYMYVVPNLEHIEVYRRWAQVTYPKAEFVQVPHYGLYGYIKTGFMGCEQNPKQRKYKLADIIDKVREKTGIEWCCCGFKQTDSLNRLLMLRSYKDGKESICYAGKKFYPLSVYKNKDMLDYIQYHNLKNPEMYGDKGNQSNGACIDSYLYLKYLQMNYPNDLEKVYAKFPRTRFILTEEELRYEQEPIKAERNEDNPPQPSDTESV